MIVIIILIIILFYMVKVLSSNKTIEETLITSMVTFSLGTTINTIWPFKNLSSRISWFIWISTKESRILSLDRISAFDEMVRERSFNVLCSNNKSFLYMYFILLSIAFLFLLLLLILLLNYNIILLFF